MKNREDLWEEVLSKRCTGDTLRCNEFSILYHGILFFIMVSGVFQKVKRSFLMFSKFIWQIRVISMFSVSCFFEESTRPLRFILI